MIRGLCPSPPNILLPDLIQTWVIGSLAGKTIPDGTESWPAVSVIVNVGSVPGSGSSRVWTSGPSHSAGLPAPVPEASRVGLRAPRSAAATIAAMAIVIATSTMVALGSVRSCVLISTPSGSELWLAGLLAGAHCRCNSTVQYVIIT